MKKIWVYLLGVLSGIVLVIFTVLSIYLFSKTKPSDDITFFDEPGEIMTFQSFFGRTETVKCFEVFQALGDGAALAKPEDWLARDLIVLLWNDKGTQYYDNQKVFAPDGKCFRQIGIYKYESKEERNRIVPVVTLMDDVERVQEPQYAAVEGVSFFKEPGEVMSDKSYKVSKVLGNGSALARGKTKIGLFYYGKDVLLWDKDANYYDDQVVKAPDGQCFRQIGIYKNGDSTYPIVSLIQDDVQKTGESGGSRGKKALKR